MKKMLLGFAALAATGLFAAPALAESTHGHHHRDGSPNGHARIDNDRRDRHSHDDIIMDWDGGAWAYYNNRTFASDSYNDWWHDRPDRAYPRWMARNQGCARMWYAGDTLTC